MGINTSAPTCNLTSLNQFLIHDTLSHTYTLYPTNNNTRYAAPLESATQFNILCIEIDGPCYTAPLAIESPDTLLLASAPPQGGPIVFFDAGEPTKDNEIGPHLIGCALFLDLNYDVANPVFDCDGKLSLYANSTGVPSSCAEVNLIISN